ncbi:MAG: thioredoxin fold domain-containing protein [Hydrogenophaga sp.]|uniref:thioredoxin fold domain-containing protein n=1 Tax=Hydrogenophaga sp. TaxID=1904254 RepID=UPI001D53F5D8|nr:thioredoxin fold domain-containing protein [Hydrogenophaga sp.]MBX3608264.1 thioredoxin fold domain-containing protein [Hydrogenophaga sp.]
MAYQPLPTPASLRATAQAAAERGQPLVVMTTLQGCVYCELVRNSYLHPFMREGKAIAVQLDVQDRATAIQGFDGSTTSPASLAQAWKARFTPTVMFFGPDGRELAERLVGVASADYYGQYLEQRLETAQRAIKR